MGQPTTDLAYRRRAAGMLVAILLLSLTGCCYFLKLLTGRVSFETPYAINALAYSGRIRVITAVTSDNEDSARFIQLPKNLNLWVAGARAAYSPLMPNYRAAGVSTYQLTAGSDAGPFATLTGTATPTATGWHFDLRGTNTSAGFPSVETLSLDMKVTPGAPATITGTANILPSVDTHGVDYSLTGTQYQTLSPATDFSPAIAHGVSLASGEYITEPVPDFSLGGTPPLLLRRYYGSLVKLNGGTSALGDNWMDNFDVRLAPGTDTATVFEMGGAVIDFMKTGVSWSLTLPQPLPYQLAQVDSNFQFFDPLQNVIYTFSAAGALMRMEDRNGNALTVTQGANGPTMISDGHGRTLAFTYNAQGKLSSVADQSGRKVSYGYTGSNLTTFTDAAGNITTYGYTSSGGFPALLTSVKRPLGNNGVVNTWDSLARMIRQADGLGNATTYAYLETPAGTATVTDALGNKTTATHRDLLHNDSVTDAGSNTTMLAWDSANRPVQVTDALGNSAMGSYDAASYGILTGTGPGGSSIARTFQMQTQGPFTFFLVSKQTLDDGTVVSNQYDASGNVTKQTDASGAATEFTRNSRGQVLTAKNALGGVRTNTYNDDGTLGSVKAPSGAITKYEYDALKRVSKITRPDGSTQSFTYDALDRVVQSSSGNGAPSNTTFDSNGNMTARSDGGGTTWIYDADDRPTSRTMNGATRSVAYDALERPKTLTNEAGEKASITYTATGQIATVADAAGGTYKFEYNALGFLRTVTDPLSQKTNYTTDASGRILTATTPLGEKSTFVYDTRGRRTAATDPLGNTTAITWGANAVTKVALPQSITVSYARNALSELTEVTDPNGGIWKQTFDSASRPTAFADPLGNSTTVSFGSGTRPESATSPLGKLTLVYDAQGHLTQQMFSDGTSLNYQFSGPRISGADNLTLAYDANNRIIESNGIKSTRDAAGRLLTVTYATGKAVTYKYDNLGLLSSIEDWAGGKVSFLYDAAHHLRSISRSDGTKTSYAHDSDGRVSSITEDTPGGSYSIELTLDAAGNVTGAGRNLPTAPAPASGVSAYTYDAASQVSGTANYDAMGRVVSDMLRNYVWDLASRLTSYSGADGAAQFTYDGFGLRASRTSGGATETYVWNYAHDLPAIAVVRSGGSDARYNVYLPDGTWIYSVNASDNSHSFAHFDEEGSTTFLTNDQGAVTDSYGITPFGESVTHSGTSTNPFTFHGAFGVMQEGNTGLYYMRARYFDSASARFLSRDPVRSANPLEVNPYQFAFNNPVGFRDPTGRHSDCYCEPRYLSLSVFRMNTGGGYRFLGVGRNRQLTLGLNAGGEGDRGGDRGTPRLLYMDGLSSFQVKPLYDFRANAIFPAPRSAVNSGDRVITPYLGLLWDSQSVRTAQRLIFSYSTGRE